MKQDNIKKIFTGLILYKVLNGQIVSVIEDQALSSDKAHQVITISASEGGKIVDKVLDFAGHYTINISASSSVASALGFPLIVTL